MQMGVGIILNLKKRKIQPYLHWFTHTFTNIQIFNLSPPSSHRSRLEEKNRNPATTAGAHLPCSPEATPAPSSTYVWTYMAAGWDLSHSCSGCVCVCACVRASLPSAPGPSLQHCRETLPHSGCWPHVGWTWHACEAAVMPGVPVQPKSSGWSSHLMGDPGGTEDWGIASYKICQKVFYHKQGDNLSSLKMYTNRKTDSCHSFAQYRFSLSERKQIIMPIILSMCTMQIFDTL